MFLMENCELIEDVQLVFFNENPETGVFVAIYVEN